MGSFLRVQERERESRFVCIFVRTTLKIILVHINLIDIGDILSSKFMYTWVWVLYPENDRTENINERAKFRPPIKMVSIIENDSIKSIYRKKLQKKGRKLYEHWVSIICLTQTLGKINNTRENFTNLFINVLIALIRMIYHFKWS